MKCHDKVRPRKKQSLRKNSIAFGAQGKTYKYRVNNNLLLHSTTTVYYYKVDQPPVTG